MAKYTNQAGFTLVEITIVLAIASGMLVIALAGQRQLRSQATFTAAVDKMIASIADTRNQAVSGVNPTHNQVGTGATNPCGAGTSIFGGTSWVASGTPTVIKRYVWVTSNTAGANNACADAAQTVTVGTPTQLTVAPAGQLLYVRRDGGYTVCLIPNTGSTSAADFAGGTCGAGETSPITFTVTDVDGHSSKVTVDPKTGLAARS